MRKSIPILIIVLGFLLVSSPANAFDYKNWIPLLPESIDGMEKQGELEGMNRVEGGQSWSLLRQKYSDADGNDIRLSIVTGPDAPGIKEFKTMQQFNIETGEKKLKTLEVSGYKAVLELNKKGGRSHLALAAQDETLVIIDTTSFDSEKGLISLADYVPLSEIADSVN